LSPEESLGPREFSDESDVEVETSDGRQSTESEEKIVRNFPKISVLILELKKFIYENVTFKEEDWKSLFILSVQFHMMFLTIII
jgi:hypothetical protein